MASKDFWTNFWFVITLLGTIVCLGVNSRANDEMDTCGTGSFIFSTIDYVCTIPWVSARLWFNVRHPVVNRNRLRVEDEITWGRISVDFAFCLADFVALVLSLVSLYQFYTKTDHNNENFGRHRAMQIAVMVLDFLLFLLGVILVIIDGLECHRQWRKHNDPEEMGQSMELDNRNSETNENILPQPVFGDPFNLQNLANFEGETTMPVTCAFPPILNIGAVDATFVPPTEDVQQPLHATSSIVQMADRSEDGISPLERGRRRYHKQDYTGALEAFTEAVKTSTDNLLVNALDVRASTYEKLGKLQHALRDAKEMIDTKPRLAKGYLRCGKVLQLRGEPAIALKIYERGLSKVKIGEDENRVKLQAMYTKLKNAQGGGVSRDPLQHLPLEIIQMIVEHLTMRDRVILLAVLKPWKKILESTHKLWTTLDTSNVKKPISYKSLKIHLRRSNYTLEQAIIKKGTGIEAERLELLTKNCKKLRELHFIGSGSIGDSLVQSIRHAHNLESLAVGRGLQITLSAVQAILSDCKEHVINATFLNVKGNHLRFVPDRWPRMDSLTTIHLRGDKNSVMDIQGLCTATPNAKSVVVNDWRVWPQSGDLSPWKVLERLDISHTKITQWPLLPKSLIHLIVSHNPHLAFKSEEPLPDALPLLETFACHSTFITGKYLKIITSKAVAASLLTRLSLGGRDSSFDDTPIQEEYPACTSLQELSLSEMIIGDERMVQIVALYPNLQKLDASATKITGVAVKHFVQLGIKHLRLNECGDVGSDAVEWARAKGVEVEYLFPSRSTQVRRGQSYRDSAFARVF